jgi:hypothetical protein
MVMRTTVVDRDMGFDALRARLQMSGRIAVGILERDAKFSRGGGGMANDAHESGDQAKARQLAFQFEEFGEFGEGSGRTPTAKEWPSILQVAMWQEFGTFTKDGRRHIPPRSFIRDWFDENEHELPSKFRRLMISVLQGRRTGDQIKDVMGLYCVGAIQKRIAEGIEPPLHPATIARKRSTVPLIDTGQLRSSVSYRVESRP